MNEQTGKGAGTKDVDFATVIPGATLKYSSSEVDAGYVAMAKWLTKTIETNLRPTMLVGPMQGALLATTEMVRRTQVPFCYRMVKVSLYDAKNQAGENVEFNYWPILEEELAIYDFVVVDDVAESLRTYAALYERLAAKEAKVRILTLVDKPSTKRVVGWKPDFSPLTAKEDEWLIAEGMNNGNDFNGEASRCVPGIWVKD